MPSAAKDRPGPKCARVRWALEGSASWSDTSAGRKRRGSPYASCRSRRRSVPLGFRYPRIPSTHDTDSGPAGQNFGCDRLGSLR